MQRLLEEELTYLRNFAEEISVECFEKGIEVDVKCTEYFVKSVLLNPDHEFIVHGKLDRTRQDDIIRLGVNFFTRGSTPELGILKLQTLYANEYVNDERIISEHNKLLFAYIEPLMQFVISFKIKNPEIDNQVLYRKIVLLTGLLSGMGDPSKQREYEEVEAAVNSIMSINELQAFERLSPTRKREQILKLTQIVTGVRLRNKQRSKGGFDIVDLPTLVKHSIEATKLRMQRFLKKYEEKIKGLTYSLENYYKWDPHFHEILIFDKKEGPYDADEVKSAKGVLTLFHQMVIILRQFLKLVENINTDRKTSDTEMGKCLEKIEEKINIKAIIPVEIIYPKFYQLSLYWNKFQNMIILLSFYNRMIKNMDNIIKETVAPLSESIKENISQFENVLSHVDEYTDIIDQNLVGMYNVFYPDENKCLSEPLEFNELCPVYCAEGNGMLHKANRNVGILQYEDKYYGFKDCHAAHLFGADPEWYLTKMLEFARKNFLFVDLLNVRPILLKASIDIILIETEVEKVVLLDAETQTDLHPVEQNINKKYKQSVWEWKKDLCQMATLLQYRTHSVQTENSSFKSTIWTQTSGFKENGMQTMCDNYTTMPNISTFQYGLRGIPSFPESHRIHFTRPIEEPPFDFK